MSFAGAVKDRVNRTSAAFLAEDIKSVFLPGKMTKYGFYYLLGGKKMFREKMNEHLYCGKERNAAARDFLYSKHFDKETGVFDINGIRIKDMAGEGDWQVFIKEIREIIGIDEQMVIDRFGYPRRLFKHIYRLESYEHGGVALNAGDVVIDAGANLGVFSALASVKCCRSGEMPGGRVYAFEPIAENVKALEETASLNEGITVVPYALSDRTGEAEIYMADRFDGHTMVAERKESSTMIKIRTTTLDDYAHENNLQRIDFIKSDIEGAERLLLKGAKGVLRDYAPKLAICTYHLPDDPQVLKELILDANPDYRIEQGTKKMYAFPTV